VIHRLVQPALALMLAFAGVFGSSVEARGHALQPGYLELRLLNTDVYAVVWKVPAVGGRPMEIAAELPERCDPRTPGVAAWDGEAHVTRWTSTCAGGLEGGVIRIEGLEKTSTDVLVRFDFADGANQAHRLTAGDPSFTVPVQPSRFDVVHTYTLLGVEHILLGIDHLAFVLALLLLVNGVRRTIATVTAFTLAHSLTLAGATLGLVHVPGPPTEAVIALSIVFLAAEIIRGRQGHPGLTERYPWVVAFSFGLLHGFGFAGALSEVGLPRAAIPIALLCFNIGVELGQLLFIAFAFTVFVVARRATQRIDLLQPAGPWTAWALALPPYAIGSLAVFWLIQRIAAF
jgi:hydrogenase/urease accessory protein HupE